MYKVLSEEFVDNYVCTVHHGDPTIAVKTFTAVTATCI